MSYGDLLTAASDWQQQADKLLIEGNYDRAIALYEQAIATEPNVKSYYWHLGLLLLLQGQEVEAQTTWLLAMAESESEEIELWTQELIEVLQTEAERRKDLGDNSIAWAIRQHIREINPVDINNLLHLIGLSTVLGTYTGEQLTEFGAIELLKSDTAINVDDDLLMQVLNNVLELALLDPLSYDLTEACIAHIKNAELFIQLSIQFAGKIGYSAKQPGLAARFIELALRLEPQNSELMRYLAVYYQDSADFDKGIEIAKLSYSAIESLAEKLDANTVLMRGMLNAGGYWEECYTFFERHKELLAALFKEKPTSLSSNHTVQLFPAGFFFPYIQDRPEENSQFRRQLAELAQVNIENYAKEPIERIQQQRSPLLKISDGARRLKVGYISYGFRKHSVGWLARWIFEHHNRDRFQIHAYLMGANQVEDPVQDWYLSTVDKGYRLGLHSLDAAEKISEDEIDILIDVDSLTLTITCETMALKPAPVQVTWLGWDASHIPTIDYYIADPYVLPESAQDYYTEKIWRLPQTYIAIDGFELGVPTLRREDLDIPSDAVIYFCAQRGFKYNPQTSRLQMQIIKEVPNSFFLIKGIGDKDSVKNFFTEVAELEGVSGDRLRFLSLTGTEAEHRANLGIADVVLDTFPYNGATTTLETLWMGIPVVTRVGQQFSARNSYTMMMNAGITEGIAWTDEEYVEWGIRLGKDATLRQQISWRLRQSRQTAPLWNAKQFTREMEKAYEQMWQIYLESRQ